jgi:hypothetical protein
MRKLIFLSIPTLIILYKKRDILEHRKGFPVRPPRVPYERSAISWCCYMWFSACGDWFQFMPPDASFITQTTRRKKNRNFQNHSMDFGGTRDAQTN